MEQPESSDVVRLHVPLSKEAVDALERLQALAGLSTLNETIEKALSLYGVQADANGVLHYDESKNVMLQNEREMLGLTNEWEDGDED